ncbi:Helix-turn-helix domain-containing protein [Thermomonospora echinospora]|uniref:Helix-turn-helix domain-containing protein n=1 Tax=Thermomonospora echinospora TaxID=1992 RepID=A0A1H6DYL0_9ACTN|nr:helix-turn-helix transcriptional regulator [Thermomonospora echinospora]SEG89715.1 Helix-turn-helix domain-containing protein [Thermomonospora echinospora]
MAEQGPTARQRKLAALLKRYRDEAGFIQEDAAELIGIERTKLVRIEGGRRIPTVADVEKILDAYGPADETTRRGIIRLTEQVRQRGWWAPFTDVLAGSYAELEHAADRIRMFQVQLVPGLLQTEDYARLLIAKHFPDLPEEEIDRRVQVRMTRQAMLKRKNPPRLEFILTEEVLRRPVGGRDMMRDQLGHLLAASTRPHVSVRIIPIDRGHYASIGGGNLVLFEFNSVVDLNVAYLETIVGGRYEENASQVRACSLIYDRLAESALPEDESAALIGTIMKET